MLISRLKDLEGFVKINDGSKGYYGGNQEWFGFTVGRFGGCGTVAAANICAYKAGRNEKYRPLYGYSTDMVEKSDFVAHMNEIYEYVTPSKIPFIKKDAPALKLGKLSFPWTFGIWSLSAFADRLKAFARSRGVELEAYRLSGKSGRRNAINFIKRGLESDCPVLLLIGAMGKLTGLEIITPNNTWIQNMRYHWVTITEMEENHGMGKTRLKVSTWGGFTWILLEDLMAGDRLKGGLMYFK